MEKIITCNLNEDFIKAIADFTQRNFLDKGKNISRLAFVFGGKRPSLFLKKEFAKRMKGCFFSPRFFSMDEFIEYTLYKNGSFSKISDFDASFEIYNLAGSISPHILEGKRGFSQFLPWAREILSFIEQLDIENIDEQSLKNIQANAVIGYDIPANINTILSGIIDLRKSFHDNLKKQNLYSRGLMYLTASEYIGRIDFEEFDHIVFCGFFHLNKTELDLAKTLLDKDKAIFFFQGSQDQWPVLDNISKRFSLPIKPEVYKNPEYKISVQSAFDVHSQVCLVREIIKGIKRPDKTVIVLPDSNNMVPLLCEIAGLSGEFNVSMGYPLNRSSLYSLFESIFKAQETKKGSKYYAKDYLRLLSHPLIKNLKLVADASATRILIHKIEDIVLGREDTPVGGSLFVDLSEMKDLSQLYETAINALGLADISISWDQIRQALEELHNILFIRCEKPANFHEFSLILGVFLDLLVTKSSLADYPLNSRMTEKIFLIKEEMGHSSFNKEPFPQEDIFGIFLNRLESEKISFSGTPLKGLQILGLLETRSLGFENVIFMDMNESVLPNLKTYEPLIPREVMISLGLNRVERDEEIQRYQFRRLIASAKNVYLIYQESRDKEKSRFIEELIWEKQKASKSLEGIPLTKASFRLKVLPKNMEINKDKGIINFLKSFEFSASSINTYLHCPLSFYYQYVLGLQEKELLLDEPEAADIGTFIHQLLEETFTRFIAKRPDIDNKFEKYFFNTLDKKFADHFQKKMKSDSFLTKEIIDYRMKRFLDNEKGRNVQEIICLENTFKDKIELGKEVFKFKAIIDRIDRMSGEDILILDYKTGDTDIMPQTDIERIETSGFSREALKSTIKSFQLPLYIYMVNNNKNYKDMKINAALYLIKDPKKDARLFKKEQEFDSREKIMRVYFEALGHLIGEITSPEAPFRADDEDPRRCKNCPFFYMCR